MNVFPKYYRPKMMMIKPFLIQKREVNLTQSKLTLTSNDKKLKLYIELALMCTLGVIDYLVLVLSLLELDQSSSLTNSDISKVKQDGVVS